MQNMEHEKLRRLNRFLRQRENDPPSLNKGNINKTWYYKTIKRIAFGEIDTFKKLLKECLAIDK